MLVRSRPLVVRARDPRYRAKPAERRLWSAIRNHAVGAKCRRQAPLGTFIADFVFLAERLAIELDGFSHNSEDRQRADALRDAWLTAQDFRTMRFSNADVLRDVEGVVDAIRLALVERRSPHPVFLPEGEGTLATTDRAMSIFGSGEGT